MIDADGREWLPDFWGDLRLVTSRCRRCDAPCIGGTLHHARGCGGSVGEWHHEARAAQDESGMRDLAQIEKRVRAYGANIDRPPGYVPPPRPPTPIGHLPE